MEGDCPVCGREIATKCYRVYSCAGPRRGIKMDNSRYSLRLQPANSSSVARWPNAKRTSAAGDSADVTIILPKTDSDVCCRSCRLDQCLLMGMDPKLVEVQCTQQQLDYFARLEAIRGKLLQQNRGKEAQSESSTRNKLAEGKDHHHHAVGPNNFPGNAMVLLPTNPNSNNSVSVALQHQFRQSRLNAKWTELSQSLAALGGVELKVREWFGRERAFRAGFVDQFQGMADVIQFRRSVIDHVHEFTEYAAVVPFGKTQFYFGIRRDLLAITLFASVDVLRSMPCFQLLHLDDQVRLANFVGVALANMRTKYHSVLMNSEVDFLMPWRAIPLMDLRHSQSYKDDQTIQHLADVVFRSSTQPFHRVRLDEQEFLLLRAIVASHPYVPNLSPHARELLQRESERFAGMLMHLEQSRLGPEAGAMRYAEVLHLAEGTFRAAERTHQLGVYIAMVADHHRFYARNPRAFIRMFLYGRE